MEVLVACLNLQHTSDDTDHPHRALFGYCVEMVSATVTLQGGAEFLKRYATKLAALIEREKQGSEESAHTAVKLMTLSPHLSLALKPELLSYDNISQLVDVIKNNLDKVETFPGELFTALRILQYLAIPKWQYSEEDRKCDVVEELKYHYALVQMHYSDLITHLNTLLTNLCRHYPQPAIYSHLYNSSDGQLILSLLLPCLSLLHALLQKVIQTRGAAHRDLTSVSPLLLTYHLLQYFYGDCRATGLQRKVLQTLLLYTLPGQSKDTQCSANSLWSQMVMQVRAYHKQ